MLELLDPEVLNLFLAETPERSARLKARPDGESGEFVYILALDTNNMIVLNRTARDVFEMCDGRTTIGAMVEKMRAGYPEKTYLETLESVVFFVRDLQAKRVLYGGSPHLLKEVEDVQC